MKKSNWAKLFSHSVEEAAALEKLPSHQLYLDALDDYRGRVNVDGESYSTDALRLLYLTAVENVMSPAVSEMMCATTLWAKSSSTSR